MRAELADGNWKLRLEGADRMTAWLGEGHASDLEAEVFFRFYAKVPGWSEKNFQVRAYRLRPPVSSQAAR
jgi:cytoskeleton-associated protein 5